MGSLNPFSKPKPQPISLPTVEPTAAAAPTLQNSAADIAKAQADETTQLKKQRGRAATILTSGRRVAGDDSSSGGLATKALLGGS